MILDTDPRSWFKPSAPPEIPAKTSEHEQSVWSPMTAAEKAKFSAINGGVIEKINARTANAAQPETGAHMSFGITSIGHYLAVGLHDAYTGIKAVEGFIAKADTPQNQALVEGLTGLIPVVGPTAVTFERGLFAVGGQVAGILSNVSNGGEQKLLDAGFDAEIIAEFKALIAAIPSEFTTPPASVAKAAVAKPA